MLIRRLTWGFAVLAGVAALWWIWPPGDLPGTPIEPAAAAGSAAAGAPAQGALSIDSRIRDLMANPATRPVMDKYFPKLTENSHYFMLEDMSVRDLAPISDGKLTEERLAKIQAELAAAR